tara:strand:- start:13 stop:423 length:411 start_codon:yes stop_codon:yes gene_type:complete
MINIMEDKINELYLHIKEIQKTVQEIRSTQKGYMSHDQASDIATKITDSLEEDPARYFTTENHEFEISGGDRIELYDYDIAVDDEDLLHSDIIEILLDYYGEPKAEPPKDNPVQFNSVPEESKEEGHDATTGALAK